MLISSLKLEDTNCEVMVIVGADSIKDPTCGTSSPKHGLNYCGKQDCEESELLYDLKTKYLGSFDQLKHVQPTSFEKACAGKSSITYIDCSGFQIHFFMCDLYCRNDSKLR